MSAPEPVPCRWKHLRGKEHDAVYRATCGRPRPCPGHLGDLSYIGSFTEEAAKAEEEARRERRASERAVAHGQSTANIAAVVMREMAADLEEIRLLEDIRRLRDMEQAGVVPAPGYWFMQACWVVNGNRTIPIENQAIYYGHPDTGYRISYGGKRSRGGLRVGRRPDVRPTLPTSLLADLDDPRGVDGQEVRPPARIWCPVCGTLNRLDWPDPLQDAQAR
jgi:hypothetical protein